MNNLISVITVCLNAEMVIERTIKSVLNQEICDYEYLVIDGKSEDKTIKIVNDYKTAFKNKGISYYIVNEKDEGIYDAMNKGIGLSKGKWIIFLNAGDKFVSSNILKKTSQIINAREDADVYYGDIVCKTIVDKIELYLHQKGDAATLENGMTVCHQAMFTKRECLLDGFSLNYKIASDYDLYLGMYNQGKKFKHMGFIIAEYDMDGVSENNRSITIEEILDIKRRYGVAYQDDYKKLRKIKIWEKLKTIIRKFIPERIYNRYRIYRIRSIGFSENYPKIEME